MNRQGLRLVCDFFGGVRAVARATDINHGNLSRWFQGGTTLSDSNVALLLETFRLPEGVPEAQIVHVWHTKNNHNDLSPALKLFFPNGAQIAHAPWTKPGLDNARKLLQIGKKIPAVYWVTDGTVRAVLRMPSGLLLQNDNLGDLIKWKGGDKARAVLDVDPDDENWTNGTPTIEEFDAAWSGKTPRATQKDLVHVVRDLEISFDEAIRRIRKG